MEIESNSRFGKYKESVHVACLTNSQPQFEQFSHLDPPYQQ
jgi:hypothetical protein